MEKSKLKLWTIFDLVFDFICEVPVTTSMSLNGIAREAAVQWYAYCRDICSAKMLKDKVKLGGINHEVQIDESLLFKRKSHTGRVLKQYWVVGFYDNTLKKGYLEYVPDRTKNTLEAVISENVKPGTTIYTDEWASYRNLSEMGYVHGTVNHSRYFVDPTTGVCTNNVESYWARIKRRLKFKFGSVGEMKWSHIDEAMYRDAYRMTCDIPISNFKTFLKHIAEIYHE